MKAMKYVLTVVLVLAAIIAAQMGLTGLIGFRTAELMGKTAVTALCVLLFTLFHFPCGTTCLTIWRETRSAKWTALAAVLPTAVGMGLCMAVKGACVLLGLG